MFEGEYPRMMRRLRNMSANFMEKEMPSNLHSNSLADFPQTIQWSMREKMTESKGILTLAPNLALDSNQCTFSSKGHRQR
jgi:hypothetical protein